ncbi:MAG TPA: DUF3179 domain-containing (seleno)protein [Vicinamibacteria bacterium]|nr:DUF3179 domain-containing (seleno)protein [Vicinamibacteria bacterium]
MLTACALLVGAVGASAPADDAPPAAFHRYLPRGRIPSLDDPRFVPASEAHLPPDAWVLGVVMGGQARAYDLNLLTRHEVVNDRYGDEPVAAVWCPLANTAIVYSRRIKGRELHFEPSGVLMHGAIVMQDKETDSYWPILQGQAMYGELTGTALEVLPVSTKVLYRDWLRQHPDTLVLSSQGREHLERNPLEPYLASSFGFRGLLASDTRLPTKEPVFGFELAGRRYAARAADLVGGHAFRVGTEWVFLYRPPAAALNEDTLAFASPSGFEPSSGTWSEKATAVRFDPGRRGFTGKTGSRPVQGFDTFWYVWSLNHPDTELLSLP